MNKVRRIMNKVIWFIKQLFPFVYVSTYRENGQRKLTVWKMWLGRSYKIRDYRLENN